MKLSVIIVNYNTRKLLKNCLSSIFKKTRGVKIEVIVVDNASVDGSIEMIQKEFPQVILIKNRKNLGFAGGNNIGIKKARGEYILLLNSDTRIIEDSLSKMVNFMEENPQIGISSCQLVGEDGKIQPSGGFFPSLFRIFAWMFFLDDIPFLANFIRSFHPHPPQFYTHNPWYKLAHFQDWITGAFFLIRKKVVEEIGLLDENFFMYVEEMDYCFRAKKRGWKVFYTPLTKIIHLGGKSGGSKMAILGEYQGLKYFYQKHMPSWQMPFLRGLLKIGALFRIFLFGIIKKDLEARKIYAEAFRIA